jgi:hypothetical protein
MIDGLDAVAVAEKYKKRRGFFKRWTIFDIKKLGGVVNNKVRERQWLEQRECLVRLTDLILGKPSYALALVERLLMPEPQSPTPTRPRMAMATK